MVELAGYESQSVPRYCNPAQGRRLKRSIKLIVEYCVMWPQRSQTLVDEIMAAMPILKANRGCAPAASNRTPGQLHLVGVQLKSVTLHLAVNIMLLSRFVLGDQNNLLFQSCGRPPNHVYGL